MAHRGHTGASMGGRVVRRKDLKPKKAPAPVDPSTFDPEALARREAYRREQEARAASAQQRAEEARAAKAAEQEKQAGSGRRLISADEAVRRRV